MSQPAESFIKKTNFLLLTEEDEILLRIKLDELKTEAQVEQRLASWYLGTENAYEIVKNIDRLLRLEQWIFHITGDLNFFITPVEVQRDRKIWMLYLICAPYMPPPSLNNPSRTVFNTFF